jgi:nitronate monooxygenase
MPFDAAAADVLEEFKPPIISFHFGLPPDDLLARVKAWGSTILSSATTVEEARYLESKGVDAVIAQGAEAGGHRGMFLTRDLSTQIPLALLVPQVVEVIDIPAIAAGGIATTRDVEAAMALGADGVQVGTAYLFCPEATINQLHRLALLSDRAATTAITNLFTGRPARGIVNRLMREVGPLNPIAPEFPLAASAIAALRAKAEPKGIDDFTSLWAGQNARNCREISAADLTRQLGGGAVAAKKWRPSQT